MKAKLGILLALGAFVWTASSADTTPAADSWKDFARYEFEYRVKLAGIAPEGSKIAVWIPYPAENESQRIIDSKIESPLPWKLHTEKRFGNRMVYAEGKMPAGDADIVMRLQVDRSPYRGVPLGAKRLGGARDPKLFEGPDKLVPLQGEITEIAAKQSEGIASKDAKIRAFYDYVYETMTYNKDGTGWGRGDAIWACTNKRGNCTDFHSLLIAMARSQGIPARFLIGFPIPDDAEGEIGGYHCWAELYDEKRGWIPVDASEAKKKGLKDAYFGVLPNNRIEFSLGRDLVLDPPQHGDPLNYFIYPYVEIDGIPAADPKHSFRFKRIEREKPSV